MANKNFYNASYRNNLADNSDIEELERQRNEANAPPKEPEVVVENAPDPEQLPAPVNVEEEAWKKRYADLRRHQATKEKEFNAKLAALEAKLQANTETALDLPKAGNKEAMKRWIEENPEIAEIVTGIANIQAESQTAELKRQLEVINQERSSLTMAQAKMKLKELHPDLDSIAKDVDFHAWVDEQPDWVKKSLYENQTDYKGAARALDLYKLDNASKFAPKSKPKKNDPDATMAVVSKNRADVEVTQKKVWKESEIERMNHHAFAKYEDDIMLARQEGRIVYDLTQKNASM